jgi:hypothetical protein
VIIVPSPELENDFKSFKFLVSKEANLQKLFSHIRARFHGTYLETEAMYLFFNGRVHSVSESLGAIYQANKNKDGMLYGMLCKENAFGN